MLSLSNAVYTKSAPKSLLEHAFDAVFHDQEQGQGLPPSTKDELSQHLKGMMVSSSRMGVPKEHHVDAILGVLMQRNIVLRCELREGLPVFYSRDYFMSASVPMTEAAPTHQTTSTPSATHKKPLQHPTSRTSTPKISRPFKSPMLNKQSSTPVPSKRVRMMKSSSASSTPLKAHSGNSIVVPQVRNNPELLKLESDKRELDVRIHELEGAIRKKRLYKRHQETDEAQKVDFLIQKWVAVSKEALLQLRDTIGVTSLSDPSTKGIDSDFGWHEETNPIVLLMKAFKKENDEQKEEEGEQRLMTLKEVAQKLGFDLAEIGEYDVEHDCFK
ncbi:hypothetical protein SeMB42_g07442 [Synchytrium endobioticum]|uniref:Swi5-dependent recombination DNA repair protein 1 homolog n=1 Tax=Synchytrium endobioticum TaxID=286115 RepID=A0A507C3L8_9FUNG|nr:hypothetical protein SeMB42_g07442 [Synchytrium endobioticum]TPX43602.1 hypothetical protein SeLEV6574_g04968 [Synchytrium endobioticum]